MAAIIVRRVAQHRRAMGIRCVSMKHQEIEGPTVERDLSPLANETREAIHSGVRSVYGLSRGVAVLGLVHLGVGAWMAAQAQAQPMAAVQSVVAFGFPFSAALVMRRSLKPIHFFNKMEHQGRLQILTLSLQSLKTLNQLFLRLTALSFASALALSFSLLYLLFSNS